MLIHNTDTICALTGANPANLRRWQRLGLVSARLSRTHWNESQLKEIRHALQDTAGGATSLEISVSRSRAEPVKTFGWPARHGELIDQLESGSDRQLARVCRRMSRDFCGDDFINKLMRPLSCWLQADERKGAAVRLLRFNELVEHLSLNMSRASFRADHTPLLLEIPAGADETSVLLEVIRLTGQGFCVDVYSTASGALSHSIIRSYDHHLLWKDNGKTCVKPEWNVQA